MDFYFAYKIQKDLDNIRYNLKNKNIKKNVNLNNRNLNNENKDRCKCCHICGQNKYWCVCEIIMTG